MKNLELRYQASSSNKAKYRAITNSILLRLKKRIDDHKIEQAKELQKENLTKIGEVIAKYLPKRE